MVSYRWTRLALVIVASFALGCRPTDGEKSTGRSSARAVVAGAPTRQDSVPARAASASDTSHGYCTAQDEATALACSHGRAWRSGDTLFVRPDSGKVLTFVERTDVVDGV